jgi:hypothetical protein
VRGQVGIQSYFLLGEFVCGLVVGILAIWFLDVTHLLKDVRQMPLSAAASCNTKFLSII